MSRIFKCLALASWVAIFAVQISCNKQPTDQGQINANEPPDTFFAPLPLDGSTDNSFKLRLEWRGNDRDGRVAGYEYRVEGPFNDNNWQFTSSFFVDFKFRDGWYTVQVRAVDNNSNVDPTPASLRFHVKGPTFDKGLLIMDDWPQSTTEAQNDVYMDSLLIGAGYTNYTVWDYSEKFIPPLLPKFADADGLGAYTSIVWHTHAGGNLGTNERTLQDYLDMGGNLWIAGDNPLESLTGAPPAGVDFPTTKIVYRYFKVIRANTAALNMDWLLAIDPVVSDLHTSYQIPNTPVVQYLTIQANQLVAQPGVQYLYKFSTNYYRDPVRSININSENFAGTSCAMVYDGASYNTAVFGFPLVFVVRAGPVFVNLINTAAMTKAVEYVLSEVFQEPKGGN